MRITLYTLIVNGYAPEITDLTLPLMRRYADKIGADVHIISERKFPEFPAAYEKLQIYTLARERGDDWAFFVDADTLIHPDFFSPIDHLAMDTVCHNGRDMAGERWRYDDYFRRDGRHIGSCNWLTIGSRWCLDLWHPLDDLTLDQAVANIYPVEQERQTGLIDAPHLLDDYVLSRNIARYGLKFTTIRDIMAGLNYGPTDFLWHQYLIPRDEKVRQMRDVLTRWKLI